MVNDFEFYQIFPPKKKKWVGKNGCNDDRFLSFRVIFHFPLEPMIMGDVG